MGVIECWYTKADKLPVEIDNSKDNIKIKITFMQVFRAQLSDWINIHIKMCCWYTDQSRTRSDNP